jgi:nucleoside 2-deoxyribosyltransferase
VFSPYHDVGIGAAEDVVPQDIEALDECQAVLAIVDGADAGTLFEVGYARAKGIRVIAIAENESAEPLKMLRGTGCEVHSDLTTAVYRAAWAAMEALSSQANAADITAQ